MDDTWRPAGLLGDLVPGEVNDACCWACSGGGDVVCCDGCRSVYHLTCINLPSLPEEEDWFCPLCSCKQCKGPCKTIHPAVSVMTDSVALEQRALKPRQSPKTTLPDGAGYVCPQQLRSWLHSQLQQQQQPPTHQQGASGQQHRVTEPKAAAGKRAAGAAAEQEEEPKLKRQRRDPVVAAAAANSSNSNNSSVPAVSAADDSTLDSGAFIRCCCCQRACHIGCLPSEQQQHVAAWAAAPLDSTGRDQDKASARASRRIRSPRQQKKQPIKQEQEEQQRQQQQQEQERLSRPLQPYFCSPGCKHTATQLAKQCAQGCVQLDALPDGTPICWQLIQPAAVAAALAAAPAPAAAAPGGSGSAEGEATQQAGAAAAEARSVLCDAFAGAAVPPKPVPAAVLLGTGAAPAYSQQQAEVLAQVLRDTQVLLAQQLGPVWEVRCYQHCLPWLLSGLRQPTPGGLLDLSHFHVAVLWVGSTLAAAALLRVHGGEGGVLEVSLAATSPLLQHRRLGPMLIGVVERFAMEACKAKQAWMPALGGVVKPCVGVSVLPGWEPEGGARPRVQLAPGCSTKLLGLDSSPGSNAGGAAAGSTVQAAEDAAQKVPKGVAACWALKLSYGRAANVTDWLQLTKCPLLRYSYVPFVSKRLEPQSMLPMPHFKRQQPARPPPLPPLPPQAQLQQRFGHMQQQLLPPPHLSMQQRPGMPMMGPNMQPLQLLPGQPMQLLPGQPMQQSQPQPQQQSQTGPPGAAAAGPDAAAAASDGARGADSGAAGTADTRGDTGADTSAATGAEADDTEAGPGAGYAASQGSAMCPAQPAAAARGAGARQDGEAATSGSGDAQHQQTTPVSNRQKWKEQVMQQFLAQQRAYAAPAAAAAAAPTQQAEGQLEGRGDDAADAGKDGQGKEAGGAADGGGAEPMQV